MKGRVGRTTRKEKALDGIPLPVVQLGPWALFLLLVFLVVRALVRGDLVPRKTHEDALHNADMWRAAHMISEQARQEERDQKRQLLEYARLGTHVVTSLPSIGNVESIGDEDTRP